MSRKVFISPSHSVDTGLVWKEDGSRSVVFDSL